jgi:hypothetical protein
MNYYYFVGSSLPVLKIETSPEITFDDLLSLIQTNFEEKDLEKVNKLRRFIDIKNLKKYWLKQPIDMRGNLKEKEIEEQVLIHDFFSGFVFDFIEKYENIQDRIKYFSSLLAHFFQREIEENQDFLSQYFSFERNVRLILLALRSKKYNRDISKELQFEDFKDPLVANILSQKDMDRFDPPSGYEELANIYLEHEMDPIKLSMELIKYKLRTISEMVFLKPFTVDYILGYMVRLMLVEDWQIANEQKARQIVDSLL